MKLSFILFFCVISLNALIIKSGKIEILKKYSVGKDALIVCDIDNTILESENEIGSDQWFEAFFKYEKEKNGDGYNQKSILKKILPYVYDAQRQAKIKLVESMFFDLIKEWQDKQIPLIGLTARGAPMLGLTKRQLLSLNIDFLKTSPIRNELILGKYFDEPAIFYSGILFCNTNSKDKVLKDFFERINWFPKKVIAIDDKETHLYDLQKVCEELKIEFIGIRYSYLDEKVKNFKFDLSMLPKNYEREYYEKSFISYSK